MNYFSSIPLILVAFLLASATFGKTASLELKLVSGELQDNDYIEVEAINSSCIDAPVFLVKGLQEGDPGRYFYDIEAYDYGSLVSIVAVRRPGWFTCGRKLSNDYIMEFLPEMTYIKHILINKPGQPVTAPGTLDNTIVLTIDYNSDIDRDGLDLNQEIQFNTNDRDADSDSDFLNDFIEVFGTNIMIHLPHQSFTVNTVHTDPLNPDSDNDGVLDGVEVFAINGYAFVTDPNNPDTDGDGILDGNDPNPLGFTDQDNNGLPDEWVAFWQAKLAEYGLPASWLALLNDPDADPDNDGISNMQEFLQGTNPLVPEGQYDARLAQNPFIISVVPDQILTTGFSIINMSCRSTTGCIHKLTQPWITSLIPEQVNFPLQLQGQDPNDDTAVTYFISPLAGVSRFSLVINASGLQPNTIYTDVLKTEIGTVKKDFPFELHVSVSDSPNHAPAIPTLLSPVNGKYLPDVCNQQLSWQSVSDPDQNDSITYEVRCSAYHTDVTPNIFIPETTETHVTAISTEHELTDRLEHSTRYQWQIVAADDHGARSYSPVWTFNTQGESPIPPVTIPEQQLTSGTKGMYYRASLKAHNGWPSYSWEHVSGIVPSGLSLTPTGKLIGIPKNEGTFTFTVEATDKRKDTVQKQLTISIVPQGNSGAGTIHNGTLGKGTAGNPNQ